MCRFEPNKVIHYSGPIYINLLYFKHFTLFLRMSCSPLSHTFLILATNVIYAYSVYHRQIIASHALFWKQFSAVIPYFVSKMKPYESNEYIPSYSAWMLITIRVIPGRFKTAVLPVRLVINNLMAPCFSFQHVLKYFVLF